MDFVAVDQLSGRQMDCACPRQRFRWLRCRMRAVLTESGSDMDRRDIRLSKQTGVTLFVQVIPVDRVRRLLETISRIVQYEAQLFDGGDRFPGRPGHGPIQIVLLHG